jgi:hypothetical protein
MLFFVNGFKKFFVLFSVRLLPTIETCILF